MNRIDFSDSMLASVVRNFAQWYLERDCYKKDFYRSFMGAVEKPCLEAVLNFTKGSQLKAAKLLGVNRNTLHSRIKKLKIKIKKS